jgi:hypothetical protein
MPLQDLGGRLRAHAGGAGQAVGGIAPQGNEVRDELGRDAVSPDYLIGVDRLEPGGAGLQVEHGRVRIDALVHVAVAGEDQGAAARGLLGRGVGTQEIVSLQFVGSLTLPAEGPEEVRGLLELPGQRLGDGWPVGVVGREQLDPVGGGLRSKAHHDRPRTPVCRHSQQGVGGAEQAAHRTILDAGDRLGKGEERAVEEERSVDDEQRAGHGASLTRRQVRPAGGRQRSVIAGPPTPPYVMRKRPGPGTLAL